MTGGLSNTTDRIWIRGGILKIQQNIDNNNVSVLNALENYSTKQVLTQSLLNALQEYDRSDREATIPWLDQVELVVERTGIDPLEVGISKLKGLALADISTFHKEEGLSWHKFRQAPDRTIFKCTVCS